MMELHEAIAVGIGLLAVANLGVLGILWFQHRLMWREYALRHKMNGNQEATRDQ